MRYVNCHVSLYLVPKIELIGQSGNLQTDTWNTDRQGDDNLKKKEIAYTRLEYDLNT